MSPAAAAQILDAHPRGSGSWYVVDCPHCGTSDAVALSRMGWECRFDGCRRRGKALATLVARCLVVRGWAEDQIRRALRAAAA